MSAKLRRWELCECGRAPAHAIHHTAGGHLFQPVDASGKPLAAAPPETKP